MFSLKAFSATGPNHGQSKAIVAAVSTLPAYEDYRTKRRKDANSTGGCRQQTESELLPEAYAALCAGRAPDDALTPL